MSPFIMRRCDWGNQHAELVGKVMLRPGDMRELSVFGDPGEALSQAIQKSDRNVWYSRCRETGALLAVFGWTHEPTVPGRIIWMVATNNIIYFKRPFYRVSRKIINHWLDRAGLLHNFIDTRNVEHIEWLERLGFKFPNVSMNYNDVEFQYFFKEK